MTNIRKDPARDCLEQEHDVALAAETIEESKGRLRQPYVDGTLLTRAGGTSNIQRWLYF
jgi:hypothetical protein